QRVRHLDQRLRPEGVAHLRAADGDLGDAVPAVVETDVLVLADLRPLHRRVQIPRGVTRPDVRHGTAAYSTPSGARSPGSAAPGGRRGQPTRGRRGRGGSPAAR